MFDWIPSMTVIVAEVKELVDVLGPEMWFFIFLPVALASITAVIFLFVRTFQWFGHKIATMMDGNHHSMPQSSSQSMTYDQWAKRERERGYNI